MSEEKIKDHDDEVGIVWETLKDMRQIHADGIFFCKNQKGERVVLLYNASEAVFMTCNTGDCDHGFNFADVM